MRDAITAGGGVEIRTEGDAFFAVFPSATGAVATAVQAQRGMDEGRAMSVDEALAYAREND
jgi:class 3 adenylate cyclase